MAHFENVRAGHERWTAQWPCTHACMLRTSQSHAGLGSWPVAFDAGSSQTLRSERQRRETGFEGAERCGLAGLWPGKC